MADGEEHASAGDLEKRLKDKLEATHLVRGSHLIYPDYYVSSLAHSKMSNSNSGIFITCNSIQHRKYKCCDASKPQKYVCDLLL